MKLQPSLRDSQRLGAALAPEVLGYSQPSLWDSRRWIIFLAGLYRPPAGLSGRCPPEFHITCTIREKHRGPWWAPDNRVTISEGDRPCPGLMADWFWDS